MQMRVQFTVLLACYHRDTQYQEYINYILLTVYLYRTSLFGILKISAVSMNITLLH